MFGRKGQGAMEYLMTYGWAILVVMIVGIVMWQLGIFNMGGTTVTATGFAKIKPQLAGTGVDAGGAAADDGTFKSVFTNGVGTTIHIDGVNVGDGSTQCTGTAGISPETVAAGQNFQISVGSCPAGSAGEIYNYDVSIEYTVNIGGVESVHHESGSVRGPLE